MAPSAPARRTTPRAVCALATAALGVPLWTSTAVAGDDRAAVAGPVPVTDPAPRRYQATGTAVTGSTELLGAPALAPGRYLDALDPGERVYYALDLADGVTPYLAATLVPAAEPPEGRRDDTLTVALYGPDGRTCGSVSGSTSQSDGGTASTVVASPGAVGSGWTGPFSASSSSCGAAGSYRLSVERDGDQGSAALPLELRVLVEPPPANRSVLPASPSAVPAALPTPVPRAPLTPVTGGSSFATATGLTPGAFTDSVRPGETVYYRVTVGWGQRLAFTAQVPPAQPGAAASLPTSSLTAFVAGPALRQLTLLDGARTDDGYSGRDEDGATVTGSTAPVLFRNRDVDQDTLEPLSLAGDHYLVVQLGTSQEHGDVAVPLRLAVEVTGEQAGAPQYARVPGAAPVEADRGAAQRGGLPWRRIGYGAGGLAALLAAGALLRPVLPRRAPRPDRAA